MRQAFLEIYAYPSVLFFRLGMNIKCTDCDWQDGYRRAERSAGCRTKRHRYARLKGSECTNFDEPRENMEDFHYMDVFYVSSESDPEMFLWTF